MKKWIIWGLVWGMTMTLSGIAISSADNDPFTLRETIMGFVFHSCFGFLFMYLIIPKKKSSPKTEN